MKGHLARVRYAKDGPLCFIASRTGVYQVCVFASSIGVCRYGDEMVDVECGAAVIPLLAMKAVCATEDEFIPEPVPIAVIVFITFRAVAPDVRHGGVFESKHQTF